MRKVGVLIFSIVFLLVGAVGVNAKTVNPNANSNGQIPEISGDYAVEGNPKLRVRVFVHGEKAGNHTTQVTAPICEAIFQQRAPRPSQVMSHGFYWGDTGTLDQLTCAYRFDPQGLLQVIKEKIGLDRLK